MPHTRFSAPGAHFAAPFSLFVPRTPLASPPQPCLSPSGMRCFASCGASRRTKCVNPRPLWRRSFVCRALGRASTLTAAPPRACGRLRDWAHALVWAPGPSGSPRARATRARRRPSPPGARGPPFFFASPKRQARRALAPLPHARTTPRPSAAPCRAPGPGRARGSGFPAFPCAPMREAERRRPFLTSRLPAHAPPSTPFPSLLIRSVSTAPPRTRPGRPSPTASSSASPARACTARLACTCRSSGPPRWTPGPTTS